MAKEGETVQNELGGKQAFIPERYDLVPPTALKLLTQCLAFGANKYGEWNWVKIHSVDHLNHAIRHIYEHLRGDQSEPHLANAMARIMFAAEMSIVEGTTEEEYERGDCSDENTNA